MDFRPSSPLSSLPPSSLPSLNPPPLQRPQDLSDEKKTDIILQCLRSLRLSLPAFFKLAMGKTQYKAEMVRAFEEDTELVASVMPRAKQH